MGILGDFKTFTELVEKATARAQQQASQKNLNAFLIALKQNGGAASARQLEELGFRKLQIIQASEMAASCGFLVNGHTLDDLVWLLSQEGDYYAEALLEDLDCESR